MVKSVPAVKTMRLVEAISPVKAAGDLHTASPPMASSRICLGMKRVPSSWKPFDKHMQVKPDPLAHARSTLGPLGPIVHLLFCMSLTSPRAAWACFDNKRGVMSPVPPTEYVSMTPERNLSFPCASVVIMKGNLCFPFVLISPESPRKVLVSSSSFSRTLKPIEWNFSEAFFNQTWPQIVELQPSSKTAQTWWSLRTSTTGKSPHSSSSSKGDSAIKAWLWDSSRSARVPSMAFRRISNMVPALMHWLVVNSTSHSHLNWSMMVAAS